MTKSDDTGKLVLRVALGILILLHGIAKVGKGVDGIGGMLASHGLPAILAYGVYIGEILAPVLQDEDAQRYAQNELADVVGLEHCVIPVRELVKGRMVWPMGVHMHPTDRSLARRRAAPYTAFR